MSVEEPSGPIHDPLDEQRRRNRQSRDAWSFFADHRAHVTDLIIAEIQSRSPGLDPHPGLVSTASESSRNARVAVLGAGNLNDLDLARLIPHCGSLDLIDLDEEALIEGMARQLPGGNDRVRLRGGVDLTLFGRGDSGGWLESTLSPPYDVVVSTCVLSQLLEPLVCSSNSTQGLPLAEIQLLRQRHVLLILDLLVSGGRGLLLTDVVSSVTCEELDRTAREDLPALLDQLVAQRNFFTGLNPYMIDQMMRTTPDIVSRLASLSRLSPWSWNLGPRIYLVCGWELVKGK